MHSLSNAVQQKHQDALLHVVALCSMQASMLFWLFWRYNPLWSKRFVTLEFVLNVAPNVPNLQIAYFFFMLCSAMDVWGGRSKLKAHCYDQGVPVVFILLALPVRSLQVQLHYVLKVKRTRYVIWNAVIVCWPLVDGLWLDLVWCSQTTS